MCQTLAIPGRQADPPVRREESSGSGVPSVQRVLSKEQIVKLVDPLRAVFASNGFPAFVEATFHSSLAKVRREGQNSTDIDKDIWAECRFELHQHFAGSLTVLAALRGSSQMQKITAFLTHIWGDAKAKELGDLLAALLDGQQDPAADEVHQVRESLPAVSWKNGQLLSCSEVVKMGAMFLESLTENEEDQILDTLSNPIDQVRLLLHARGQQSGQSTRYEQRRKPTANLVMSPMPRITAKRGVILRDCNGYDFPPPAANGHESSGAEFKKDQIVEVFPADPAFAGTAPGWLEVNAKHGSHKIIAFLEENQDVKPSLDPVPVDKSAVPLYSNPEKRPKAKDIYQQALGDCYLLAALASVAVQKPDAIRHMIVADDYAEDDVAVRFFRKQPGPPVSFTPEWIRVDKSIYAYTGTQDAVYASPSVALWPAIVEKAYAVFKSRGRGYEGIEGGFSNDAFEHILGQEAAKESVSYTHATEGAAAGGMYLPARTFKNPLTMTKEKLMAGADALVPGPELSDEEATDFLAHVQKRPVADRLSGDPAALVDLDLVIECGVAAGGAAKAKLETFCRPHLERRLGSKKYSEEACALFAGIKAALARKDVVALGTKDWGKGGTGISGGENKELVPGLASTHAYAVLGTAGDPTHGAAYVWVRNPWGEFGRRYSGGIFSEMKGEAQPEATSKLELSDVMRYCSRVYHT